MRALLICGLIRDPAHFAAYLEGVLRLPDRSRLHVVFSSWTGELDRHPAIGELLRRLGAEVVTQAPPNLTLPGHMLHQVMTLERGLSMLDDDVFVLKTRPDICGVMDVVEFLDLMPQPVPTGRPLEHRVHVVGLFVAQPLYINDIVFAGMAADLRRLCALSFVHGVRYPRLAPEQWLWATVFAPADPVLDAYLSVNPGLVFDDPARQAVHRQALVSSPLFARAVARQAMLVRDSLSFLHPDPRQAAIRAGCAVHTLEALLWDRVADLSLDHHPAAATNTCLSQGVMDAVHDGWYAPSAFGDAVRHVIEDVDRGRRADRRTLACEAAALADAIPQAVRSPPWRLAAAETSQTAAFEAEINRLRRTVDRLQARLGDQG